MLQQTASRTKAVIGWGGVVLCASIVAYGLSAHFSSRPAGGPLTDENLRVMAQSAKYSPELRLPSGQAIPITADEAGGVVRALRPLKEATNGTLEGEAEYVLSYQAGMDPLELRIQVKGDQLVYSERQYLYHGGNAEQFCRVVDAIVAAHKETPSDESEDGGATSP